MKRIAIVLLLFLAAATNAGVSLGLTLQSSLVSNSNQDQSANGQTTSSSNFNLSLGPIFRIGLSQISEVVPHAAFRVMSNSTTPGGSSSQEGLDAGCGFNFFLMSNEFMKFSLGPDVLGEFWFSTKAISLDAGMPVNVDFIFNSKWTMRISDKAVDFEYDYSHSGYVNHNGITMNLQSFLQPSFTLFYTF
jgi:hypothetical protein